MDIQKIRKTIGLLDSGLKESLASSPVKTERVSAILYFHMRKIELLTDLIRMEKNEQLQEKCRIIEKSLVEDVQILTSMLMNS
jgi:hypothetical protein